MRRKFLRTLVDVLLIVGFIFFLFTFQYLLKFKILAIVILPFILFDIYSTWIPLAAISKAYCRRIIDIRVVDYEGCYLRILTNEEKEFLINLCRKRAVECDFYEENRRDLFFEVNAENYNLLVYLTEVYPTYMFLKWKELDVDGCFGVMLETCERERLEKIVSVF